MTLYHPFLPDRLVVHQVTGSVTKSAERSKISRVNKMSIANRALVSILEIRLCLRDAIAGQKISPGRKLVKQQKTIIIVKSFKSTSSLLISTDQEHYRYKVSWDTDIWRDHTSTHITKTFLSAIKLISEWFHWTRLSFSNFIDGTYFLILFQLI